MTPPGSATEVTLGFLPESLAIADPDHPGLRRAGPRASAPYANESVELHRCRATDLSLDDGARPDLLTWGFDTVDLSGLDALQAVLARVRVAGRIAEDDAATIRSALSGQTLSGSGGAGLEVLHIADEGLIMRSSGPNGLSVVGPRSIGMNDHSAATSVHADQDVHGTPLRQLMDGRAPELFRHESPDGRNDEAGLLLTNLWIPLQQVTQPLVLADGRSIDRRRHQLRYGLATETFLDRDDEMAVNDIWMFLPDAGQRWYLHSDMDHRQAYVFNTLSTPHGACALPGEDVAERCYRLLEEAEAAVSSGDARAAAAPVAAIVALDVGDDVPPALRRAIGRMVDVAGAAGRDPTVLSGEQADAWLADSRAARRGVVRMSIELRMVVAVDTSSID